MRTTTVVLATVASLVAFSATNGQCKRGSRGGGGTATGGFSPLATSTGLNGSMASSPYGSNTSATSVVAQYRSLIAQQQYLLAQQQQLIRALTQQQRNPELPLAALAIDNIQDTSPVDGRNRTNARRESLRRQNAEKAFQIAERAEIAGRRPTAATNYRKVVRILGSTDALGRRATDALELLAQGRQNVRSDETLVASRVR